MWRKSSIERRGPEAGCSRRQAKFVPGVMRGRNGGSKRLISRRKNRLRKNAAVQSLSCRRNSSTNSCATTGNPAVVAGGARPDDDKFA